MDNLDNFLNKANSQMKVKKQEDNKNKKRERSCSSMEYNEYLKNWGPPTPLFKPLNSPNDLPPEMLLPPSELGELTDDEYRKVLSCPSELKVLVEEPEDFENDEFVMIEEALANDRTVSSSETLDNPSSSNDITNNEYKVPASKPQPRTGSNLEVITKFAQKPTTSGKPVQKIGLPTAPNYNKRARSQSENITCYSIFQFMENSLSSHKDSIN